jgi:hypothetical protein
MLFPLLLIARLSAPQAAVLSASPWSSRNRKEGSIEGVLRHPAELVPAGEIRQKAVRRALPGPLLA